MPLGFITLIKTFILLVYLEVCCVWSEKKWLPRYPLQTLLFCIWTLVSYIIEWSYLLCPSMQILYMLILAILGICYVCCFLPTLSLSYDDSELSEQLTYIMKRGWEGRAENQRCGVLANSSSISILPLAYLPTTHHIMI